MSGEDAELAAWVVSLAALAAAVIGWLPWMMRNLRHDAFGAMILRLCGAGQLDRVARLCAAAPGRPLAMGVGAALQELDGRDEPESETIQRVRDAYRAAVKVGIAGAAKTLWLGAVALAAAAGAIYLVVGEGAGATALVPSAIAVSVVIQTWLTGKRVAQGCAIEEERLVPALVAAGRSATDA